MVTRGRICRALTCVGLAIFSAQAFTPRHSVTRRPSSCRRTTILSSIPMREDPPKKHEKSVAHTTIKEAEQENDRPTETLPSIIRPPAVPGKPKIVVLGASGKIGRLVVRQLLEKENLDATIVAFCRDYDKACRVLYDDMIALKSMGKKKGPRLQIVQGDLVPPEELPGYEEMDDEEETEEWLARAKSAAAFYGNSVKDYDHTQSSVIESNESLQMAIRDCTTIISCVSSVRPTNIWTDLLERPFWRLFRKDVSGWCKDARHPYYVHYATTRKALRFAEHEQIRREAAAADVEEDETPTSIPRIRFIRISDLGVSEHPWQLIPVVANALHSMVFRYQLMAEKALAKSSLLETVVLRPGDLVDEERDVDTTSLQACPSGSVPSPARIGRQDVADLAVEAALFSTESVQPRQASNNTDSQAVATVPFHLTLACRWAGDQLDPYPAQGSQSDGCPDANLCMRKALRTVRKTASASSSSSSRTIPSLKPYGICVAVPAYLLLALTARSLLFHAASACASLPVSTPFHRIGSALALAGALLLQGMTGLLQLVPRLIGKGLSRRAQYISF